jgi:serpin B
MTSGRIKDLLEKGVVTADTRFILVDAVYLSAAWKDGFDASKTKAQDFHRLDGTTVAVQMMSREAGSSVLQGEGFTAVALPYEAEGLSLLVIMPDEGRFTAMEGQMDRAFLDGVVAGLQDQKVNLSLPRFKSRYPVDLQPILTALGMGDAFTPAADLSGITGGRDLQLQSAGHQATIDVTESGTVAAAATYVGGMLTSLPPEPLRVVIDRPFLFLIREASTGTVLFLGRVEDPTAG